MLSKMPLRDRFRQTDYLNADVPTIERIAALYFARQNGNPEQEVTRWKQLIAVSPSGEQLDVVALAFHAAIMLAETGDYMGVDYVLKTLRQNQSREATRLAATALRNCHAFPFVTVLARSTPVETIVTNESALSALFQLSDVALQSDGFDVSMILDRITLATTLPRLAGRKLGLGRILSRPIQAASEHTRYTGFVIVEDAASGVLGVPYSTIDILNQDTDDSRVDVWTMLSQPGWRALVVYDEVPPFEAWQMYLLPFGQPASDEVLTMMDRLIDSEGALQLGMVTELNIGLKQAYRVITGRGYARVNYFQRAQQEIGNVFAVYSQNDQPLSVRHRLTPDQVKHIAERFKQQAALDRAVWIKELPSKKEEMKERRHLLVTQSGQTDVIFGNEVSPATVYFIDEFVDKDARKRRFPFRIPATWTAEEIGDVLESYFEKNPDQLGVVMESYSYNGKQYARIINPNTGQVYRPGVQNALAPGTLVLVELKVVDQKEKLYTTYLTHYELVGGCTDCFGTGYRLCTTCSGTGWEDCPDCNGTRELECPECRGTLETTCGHCNGSGQINIRCKFCAGTGACGSCKGTGVYEVGICRSCNGTGVYSGYTCMKCGGDGKFKVPCKWCAGARTCPHCSGSGGQDVQCRTCKGTGMWECGRCHKRGTVLCECGTGHVTCRSCNGDRIERCWCYGGNRSHIIARL